MNVVVQELGDVKEFLREHYQKQRAALEARRELLAENTKSSGISFDNVKSNLKADVKKSSTLVNKIKSLSSETIQPILKDMETLNLKRFQGEIISAIFEAPLKPKDSLSVSRAVTRMGSMYPEFKELFMNELEQRLFKAIEESEPSVERVHVLSRILVEQVVIGVSGNFQLVVKVLRRLVRSAQPTATISLRFQRVLVGLLREFVFELLPKEKLFEGIEGDAEEEHFNHKVFKVYEKICTFCCERVVSEKQLVQRRAQKNRQELISKGSISGRNSEELVVRMRNINDLSALATRISGLMGLEIPSLEEMETPKDEGQKASQGIQVVDPRKTEDEKNAHVFGGEELRSFYQDLPDLLSVIPVEVLSVLQNKKSCLLETKSKESSVSDSNTSAQVPRSRRNVDINKGLGNNSRGDIDQALDLFGGRGRKKGFATSKPVVKERSQKPDKEDSPKKPEVVVRQGKASLNMKAMMEYEEMLEDLEFEEDDGSEEDKSNLIVPEELQELLNVLPECLSAEMCDSFCKEVCLLTKIFGDQEGLKLLADILCRELKYIPWNRPELTGFYARICVVLSQLFPSIIERISKHLLGQFRFLMKHQRENAKLDHKLRNARYIGELAKYSVGSDSVRELFPVEKALFVLHYSLRHFHGSNVNYTCECLETCGRVLYRHESTEEELNKILTELMRLKKANFLSGAAAMSVSNVFFWCKKSDDKFHSIASKKRSEEEVLVRYILLEKLEKDNLDQVSKCLLRLNWKEDKTFDLVIKYLLKVDKMRLDSVRLIPLIVKEISKFYGEFTSLVTGTLVARVISCLKSSETSVGKQQKLVGYIRLVTEMYNFRLVQSMSFFNILYFVLYFGLAFEGNEDFEKKVNTEAVLETLDVTQNQWDPPRFLNRISAVSEALMHCGNFVKFGKLKYSLNLLLLHLEFYVHSKVESLNSSDDNSVFISRAKNILFDVLCEMSKGSDFDSKDVAKTPSLLKLSGERRDNALGKLRIAKCSLNKVEARNNLIQAVRGHHFFGRKNSVEKSKRQVKFEEIIQEEEEEQDVSDEEVEEEEDEESLSSSLDSDDETSGEFSEDLSTEFFDLQKQAENQFESDLQNMMTFSHDMDKYSKKASGQVSANNMAIPAHVMAHKESTESGEPAESIKTFRLLKKSNKGRIETKPLLIPTNTLLAKSSSRDVEVQRKELAEMKEFVLQYEERERYCARDSDAAIPAIHNSMDQWRRKNNVERPEAASLDS